MGLFFSRPRPTIPPDWQHLSPDQVKPYSGVPLPPEVSTAPKDSHHGFFLWYAIFYDAAYVAPHIDGENVVVFWPPPSRGETEDQREPEGWGIRRLATLYRALSAGDEWNARVVRFVEVLDDDRGLVLEQLNPGPLSKLSLPTLRVPVVLSDQNPEDKIMLSLYIRWALQLLSALTFLHEHDVFMRAFNAESIWVRSDFSLALTGFVGGVLGSEDHHTIEMGTMAEPEVVDSKHAPMDRTGQPIPSVQEDLFYWATFVWRLVTNCYTPEDPRARGEQWEPVTPSEGGVMLGGVADQMLGERYCADAFQELEDERIGKVLVRAWKSKYSTAEAIADDVRIIAEGLGIDVIEDEVDIGRSWEDVFEVVDTEGPSLRKELVLKDTT